MPTPLDITTVDNHEEEEEEEVAAKPPTDDDYDDGADVVDNGADLAGDGVDEEAATHHSAVAAAAVAEAFAEQEQADASHDLNLNILPQPEIEDPVSAEIAAASIAAVCPKIPSAKAKKKNKDRKLRKRTCKFPGCINTVKAQGHCQRHGAKTKRCKAPGCKSQAQGSHEGFCKRHWREIAAPPELRKGANKKSPPEEPTTCEPVGASVYDAILPASFHWRMGEGGGPTHKSPHKRDAIANIITDFRNIDDPKKDPLSSIDGKPELLLHEREQIKNLIPVLQHLYDNEHLEGGWHRQAERLSRGIRPTKSPSTQLEVWEKQLAVLEMALISGTDTKQLTMHRITKVLAHAWGRERGFHKLMIDKHCARRGDLDRKKRVDAGQPMAAEKKVAYKHRAAATKQEARKRKYEHVVSAEESAAAQRAAQRVAFEASLTAPVGESATNPLVPLTEGEALVASVVEQYAMEARQHDDGLEDDPPLMPEPPVMGEPGASLDDPPPMEEPTIEEMATEMV